MTAAEIIAGLRSQANAKNAAGMARFGINPCNALGVPVKSLRTLARVIGRDHALALELWQSGIHEARILATIVDEPERVTRTQMDAWAREFDSWDVCDQACQNLFWRTTHAFNCIERWCRAQPEFVRRAGFSLMAQVAAKEKSATDEQLAAMLPLIVEAATDERNFVKKAVNWALRHIGKRNPRLHDAAVAAAERLRSMESRAARWIASDALRELSRDRVLLAAKRAHGVEASRPARRK